MTDPPPRGSATRFLGVRLTPEEESRLERFRREHDLANRSDAVRALLAGDVVERPTAAGLPVTRRAEFEDLVEDGYFTTLDGAVDAALEIGLRELVRTHTEGFPAMRRHAREETERRKGRKRADREGRGLLGR